MSRTFDILIVGGGMVGASLAKALSPLGLSIGVVEAVTPDDERQSSYDDRAIALAYGTRLIFEGMGVWRQLAPDAEPIRHIHVSDRGRFGFTRLHHQEQGLEALGYVATASSLGKVLLNGLGEAPGITLFCPARLKEFEIGDESVSVQITHEDETLSLSTRLLIAADGTRSMVREGLGIGVREWGYGQTAVISNLTPDRKPRGVAYERFTETGPMAMLPLTGDRYALVWTVLDDDVDPLMALEESEFLQQVHSCFGHRLGRFLAASGRATYPLKLVQAKEHVRPRVALLGNAAHAVHPITGQGFNLGIRDVAVLAEVLADALRKGQDPGAEEVLSRYAKWRSRDQQAVAMLTDSLVRIFTNPLPPVRLLRNLGMLALDLLPGPKRFMTRQFMGLNGRLPRLSRGLPLDGR